MQPVFDLPLAIFCCVTGDMIGFFRGRPLLFLVSCDCVEGLCSLFSVSSVSIDVRVSCKERSSTSSTLGMISSTSAWSSSSSASDSEVMHDSDSLVVADADEVLDRSAHEGIEVSISGGLWRFIVLGLGNVSKQVSPPMMEVDEFRL